MAFWKWFKSLIIEIEAVPFDTSHSTLDISIVSHTVRGLWLIENGICSENNIINLTILLFSLVSIFKLESKFTFRTCFAHQQIVFIEQPNNTHLLFILSNRMENCFK